MAKAKSILSTSFSLGTYLGIPLRLHWSFFLIIFLVLSIGQRENLDGYQQIALLLLFLVIFFCVTLHEYGHAWMAKTLGIKTRDITLSPIGGLARLEYIPKDAWKEFKIAIAGPCVNIIIFIVLLIPICSLYFMGIIDAYHPNYSLTRWGDFLISVAISNLFLALFNLLPAFPMDGGRILRALLSLKWTHLQATIFASYIGKLLALIGIVLGFMTSNYTWIAIAIFIAFMADAEVRMLKFEATQKKQPIKDQIRTNFKLVTYDYPMSQVVRNHFEIDRHIYIVQNSMGRILGVVTEPIIEGAIHQKQHGDPIAFFMHQKFITCNINDHAFTLQNMFVNTRAPMGIVMDYGEIKGYILPVDVIPEKPAPFTINRFFKKMFS